MKHRALTANLSIVITVGRQNLDLANLKKTLDRNLPCEQVEIVIVEDSDKFSANPSLANLRHEYNEKNLYFCRGDFNNPGEARNLGETKCTGEWIIFWDCDDIGDVRPFLEVLASSSADVLVAQFDIHDVNSMEIVTTRTYSLFQLAVSPGIWRMAFRRSVIQGALFPALSMAEDQVFLARCLAKTNKVKFLNGVSYTYFVGNQIQLTSQKVKMNDLEKSLQLLDRNLKNLDAEFLQFYIVLIVKQLISSFKYAQLRIKFKCLGIFLHIFLSNLSRDFLKQMVLSVIHLQKAKSKKGSSNVNMSLTGGMGNQLFQIAAGLYLSAGQGITVLDVFGEPRVSKEGKPSALQFNFRGAVKRARISQPAFFWKKSAGFILRRSAVQEKSAYLLYANKVLETLITFCLRARLGFRYRIMRGVGVGDCALKISSHPTLLFGYFQSYRWLQDDYVRRVMSSAYLPEDSDLLNMYMCRAQKENPLVIHFRIGDYINEPWIGLLPASYYTNALDEISAQNNFGKIWLFSDDPKEAIKKLPQKYLSVTEIVSMPTMTDALTLQIMRFGAGYILSNSTFGWWAAALSHSNSPKVVVPNRWFRELPEPLGLIPEHWTRCAAWPITETKLAQGPEK